MSKKGRVLRSGIKILGNLDSGLGDPILTIDTTTKDVGEIPAVDSSTFLSATLLPSYIIVGNSSSLGVPVQMTGVVNIDETGLTTLAPDSITDLYINSNAAISYSKLNLNLGIINTDISASAQIDRTKLATGTPYRIVVNGIDGNVTENVVLQPSTVLVSDNNGLPVSSLVSASTLSYLDIPSSLQGLLNNKLSFSSGITPVDGDLIYYSSGVWVNLPRGTTGQVLTATSGNIAWANGVANGLPPGGTLGQALLKNSVNDFDAGWTTLLTTSIQGVTATYTDINVLTGTTVTAPQFNFLTGATSNIQNQLNTTINGVLTSAIVRSPSSTYDGYSITWDQVGGVYTLKPSGASSGDHWATSSTTSMTVATGNQLFTIGTGLAYTTGQYIVISKYDNPAIRMEGNVVSYNIISGQVSVTIASIFGSGTYALWSVNLQAGTPTPLPNTYGGVSPTNTQVGALLAGTAIAGLTYDAIIQKMTQGYYIPLWTSFVISGQPTTVEVGTTLPTPATFTWGITLNSGTVATIDIKDVTGASTLIANTANDGTQSQALGAVQLNSNGAVRTYKGTLHDTGSSPSDIDSPLFTITARYYRFWNPVAATPNTSAAVRALTSAFQTTGNSFTLVTGTTQTKFSVNLPPGVTIVSVIDTTNLGANLTAQYVLIGTVNVTDAGGTTRAYNQYECNVASAYSATANHVITTT